MPNYLFFRVPFAFLDYEKAGWLVFLENLLMLSFWTFFGTQTALICRNAAGKAEAKKKPLLSVVAVMASVIIGIALMLVFPVENETVWLNRTQMSELFDRDIKTIGKHIANTVNTLEKKRVANNGIAPKYYVEGSHEMIEAELYKELGILTEGVTL